MLLLLLLLLRAKSVKEVYVDVGNNIGERKQQASVGHCSSVVVPFFTSVELRAAAATSALVCT
jgi:hypothetical protein